MYQDAGMLRTIKNFARFIVLILMLRLWGLPICWIAHNLYPHEPSGIPGLDWLARCFIIAISLRIFVHGPTAAGILAEEFPLARRKVVIIDHGNMINLYPRSCNREDARKMLGLSADVFVFLFIGLCREYKNIHGLLQAFEKIEEDAKLVIAGVFHSKAYYKIIYDLVEKHPRGRVIFRPGFVPDEEMQHLLTAADVVVLPYTEILTSGAAVLALSFGRPIVAPRRGYLIDLVNSACGILYTADDGEGLSLAMHKAMKQQFDEKQIINRALELDWRETAKRIVDALI
jgi:glycosyltransferase involved in cell wall biosynthesis